MELNSRALPKWAQMFVSGLPVTIGQAKEIIRRTDTFFSSGHGGNDHAWNDRAIDLLGMPHGFKFSDNTPTDWDATEAWKEAWGLIETAFVHNSWLSCPFIGGPFGWCHPDGQIGYVDNIGKYPSVEEVLIDWAALAEFFPFISVGVTLFDGEQCEDGRSTVVSIRVGDGRAELAEPHDSVHAGHPKPTRAPGNAGNNLEGDIRCLLAAPYLREHGVPWAWLEEWAKRLS